MSDQKSSVNWKTVAMVGVPLAVGAGVIGYLVYQNRKAEKDDPKSSLDNFPPAPVPTGVDSPDPLTRANALKELGNRNFRFKRFDKAIANYTDAINVCPEDAIEEKAIFYQNRAAAYQSTDKDEEALADLEAALRYKPKYVKAIARRGKIFETKKRYAEALADATAVCLFESFSVEENVMRTERIMRLLGETLVEELIATQDPSCLQLPSKQFIKTFFKSFDHDPLQKDNLTPSEKQDTTDHINVNGANNSEDGDAVVKTNDGVVHYSPPGSLGIQNDVLRRCLQHLRQQAYEEAVSECVELVSNIETGKIAVPPRERLLAYLLRGTMKYLAFQTTEAIQDFQLIITEGEQLELQRAFSGDHSNSETSVEDCRDVIVQAIIRMANALHEDPERCMELFEKAESLLPNCSDIYFHRGQQRLVAESDVSVKLASEDFDKAAKLYPQNTALKGYYFYARILNHIRNSDMRSAEKDVERWNGYIDQHSDNYESISLQGQFFVDIGQLDQAIRRFEAASKLDSESGTALVHLAMAKLRQNAMLATSISAATNQVSEEVLSLLQRAVTLEPRSVYAHEMYAMVLTQANDLEKAIEEYDLACRLPHHRKEVANLLALRESVRAQVNMMARFNLSKSEMQQLRDGAMLTMLQKSQAQPGGGGGMPFPPMGFADS